MSPKEVLIGESGRKQKAFKLPYVKCAEKKSCKGVNLTALLFSLPPFYKLCVTRGKRSDLAFPGTWS